MITIFTICRPFVGRFATIQRNAIGSWLHLHPRPEVFLFGADPSVHRYARRHGLYSFPVTCDEYGTPLVSSAVHQAQRLARSPIVCFANADNLYLSDFMPAVRCVADAFDEFLIVGQRHNLPLDEPIDCRNIESEIRLHLAMTENTLHHGVAMDYIIWRGDWLPQVPPFAVGMTAYDPWFLDMALNAGVPTVDVTKAVTVVHMANGTTYGAPELKARRERNRQYLLTTGGRRTTTGHAEFEMLEDGTIKRRGKK